jgi:hypothetical protein
MNNPFENRNEFLDSLVLLLNTIHAFRAFILIGDLQPYSFIKIKGRVCFSLQKLSFQS